MCHLNASVIIKSIPGPSLEFLLLRRDTAEDDIAVKAVTNFPAAFDQFDQLHSCYKNVRNVSIQKVSFRLQLTIQQCNFHVAATNEYSPWIADWKYFFYAVLLILYEFFLFHACTLFMSIRSSKHTAVEVVFKTPGQCSKSHTAK